MLRSIIFKKMNYVYNIYKYKNHMYILFGSFTAQKAESSLFSHTCNFLRIAVFSLLLALKDMER